MEKHISKQQIIRLISGLLNANETDQMENHLRRCQTCTELRTKLAPVLQSSQKLDEFYRRSAVKERILSSLEQICLERDKKTEPISQWTQSQRLALPAFAVIMIFVTAYLLKSFWFEKPLPLALMLRPVSGTVRLNGNMMTGETVLGIKSDLEVLPGSSAEMNCSKAMSLKMSGGTVIGVVISKTGSTTGITFKLEKGLVVVNSDSGERKLRYSFQTPFSTIAPAGTRFLLQTDKEKDILMVKEGPVTIKLHGTDKEISASPGKKYIITKTIESFQATESDNLLYNEIEKSIHGGAPEKKTTGILPEKSIIQSDQELPVNVKEKSARDDTVNPALHEKERELQREAREIKKELNSDKKDLRSEQRRERRHRD